MLAKRMKAFLALGIAVIALLTWSRFADAQRIKPIPHREAARSQPQSRLNNRRADSPWTPLTNQPTFIDTVNCAGAANPLLLTDGTVIVQEGGCQN